jgi:dTDP-4-dehydrorhamnose reductase
MVISLFIDEFRTPISGAPTASGILAMLEVKPKIIHLGGGKERISRYEFGKLIAAVMGKNAACLRTVRAGDGAKLAPHSWDVSFDSSRAFLFGYKPQLIKKEIEELNCIRLMTGRMVSSSSV